MRKRLRKKSGEGEFSGLSFGVSYVLDDVSSRRANEFLDQFVEEAIEPHGLQCEEARHDPKWDFRVASDQAGVKPTKAQRAGLVEWLAGRKELARFTVEDLA